MVEETAAKHRIEGAIFPNVEDIVFHKSKIGKIRALFDEGACIKVALSDLHAQRIKSHAREFDRIPFLQATEIDNGKLSFIPWKYHLESPFCRLEPRLF